MGYKITDVCYMCRNAYDIRPYIRPNDMTPCEIIIPAGTTFTTNHDITIAGNTYIQIENLGESTGLWVHLNSVEHTRIATDMSAKVTKNDASIAISESLSVVDDGITIYESSDSSTPICSTLRVGDTIIADRKNIITHNGIEETRYRIAIVNAADSTVDTSEMVGCWIVANYAVTTATDERVYSNPSIRLMRRATNSVDKRTKSNLSSGDKLNGSTTITYNGRMEKANTQNVITSSAMGGGGERDSDSGNITVNTSDMTEESITAMKIAEKSFADIASDYGFAYYAATDSTLMTIPVGRMLFVHGMPFQYTHLTDRRNGSHEVYGASTIYNANDAVRSAARATSADFYGMTFAKEIVANTPIAVIVPGTPIFMTNVKQSFIGYAGQSQKAKNGWKPLWFGDSGSDSFSDAVKSLVSGEDGNGEYQYYSMTIDTTGCYEYVNAMAQTTARLMGLTDDTYTIGNKKPCDFDWGKYNSSADQDYNMYEEVTGVSGGMSFAYDPLSSVSDSITNSVGDSAFSGMINGWSEKARELEFMTGTAGVDLGLVNSDDYEAQVAQNNGNFNALTSPLSRLGAFLTNANHGMNVRFPQIWQSSSYSKSYDIDMKFISPYNTAFCKWKYVLCPFIHILALSAPHSDDTVVNYSRPYLIRAFSKGYFNIEMGMIDGVNWKMFGDGDMISEDGVPMEIDVSISFQDMFQQLAISKFTSDSDIIDTGRIGIFFNNTGLCDMLGTLSGVNMNRITIQERMSLYMGSAAGALGRSAGNVLSHAALRMRNITETYLLGT